MVGISRLYLALAEASDSLRYRRRPDADAIRRPVVVWNTTHACNLDCVHCYAHAARGTAAADELTTNEGFALIDDLAQFGVPVILFSGGEPLMRDDLFALVAHARERGLRATISTNGTLITPDVAQQCRQAGVSYVGISLDGLADTNDRFRGQPGAFDAAMRGIRACQSAGVKVGLRFTMTRHNLVDLPAVFDLLETADIPRCCFYHFVDTGRGETIADARPSADDMRDALNLIMDRTADMYRRGVHREILTVDNHADGPFVYLRMCAEKRDDAEQVLTLLRRSGGSSSGEGIGCISWDGTIYPDQFSRNHPLGNIRERPFSATWSDPDVTLLTELRQRRTHVQGRCRECRFLDVCGGNLRARGEAATGDLWGYDPACYLTDEEVGVD